MPFEELIRRARSYRRFSSRPLPPGFLRKMVGYAALSPSSGNKQFLKYVTVEAPEERERLFPLLRWARGLKDWDGPAPGERPAGYAVILLDREIHPSPGCDQGIAAQSMVLGAAEEGVGCCLIGSYDKRALSALWELPPSLEPCLVLAFGYPGETVVLEELAPGESPRYYRDEAERHHVPKRSVEELLAAEL